MAVARALPLHCLPPDINAGPIDAPFLRIASAGFTLFAGFALASFTLSTSNKFYSLLLRTLSFLSFVGFIVVHFNDISADSRTVGEIGRSEQEKVFVVM
jgi:hypothetical protein